MVEKPEGSSKLAYVLSDHWLDRDARLYFDFDGLARTLAELAWNPANDTPFTVVVRGGWGRGKTTLMRRTQALLDGNEIPDGARHTRTLWFNAWKYPSEDSVLAGLLGTLLAEFRQGALMDQLKGFLKRNQGTLVRQVLRAAAPWLPLNDELKVEFSAVPLSPVEHSLIEEKRAFHDAFRDVFSRVSHLLLFSSDLLRDKRHISEEELWKKMEATPDQREGTLAIFLDDLDRCPDKRILETLEAINLFLDLPGVCFYLGLDWDRLGQILQKHFGDRTEQFLEKIVQISLELPDVNVPDAGGYIDGLVSRHPTLQETLGSEDVTALAGLLTSRHPRHVKRFLNDLSIRLAVLRNTDRLGAESPRLPPGAVVAWHLLHEALPEFARKTAKLRQNLDGFLRKWVETRENLRTGESAETLDAGLRNAHEEGRLGPFVERLEALTVAQREALVHAGSPPADEVRIAGAETGFYSRGKIDWVPIKAGKFEMGSEDWNDSRPVHPVRITHDFHIARHPVTNAQYRAYVEATGVAAPGHWEEGRIPRGKEDHPVVNVSWDDATAYCGWLNPREKREEGLSIRLPTEAEWEYVASGTGGQKRPYPWGDGEPDESRANFGGKVGDTTPVDAYPKGATPEGVMDMAGNVWEWCLDGYGEGYYGESPEDDPVNAKAQSTRVLRGGAFRYDPDSLRAAYRDGNPSDNRYHGIGFRVVLSPFSPSEP